MSQRRIVLTDSQQLELVRLRDTAAKPYLRERAAAIIKVAQGIPGSAVAQYGLLRPRQPDTLYEWLNRYEVDGASGLSIRPGRGRKPAFSQWRQK